MPPSLPLSDILALGRELGSACRLPLPRQSLSGASGERLGHGVGASLEFQDYREYQPGDDLRRLDWRAYGRTDRLMVRLHREEIQPHTDIVSDLSASMTVPETKAQAAILLAGAFAEASFQDGLSVAWHGYGNGWLSLFPKANAFPPCALPPFAGGWTLPEALSEPAPHLVRRGIRICISDFLWEDNPEPALRRLATHAAAVLLVQVLAAEELDPPPHGPVNLVDAETGERLDLQIGPAELTAYRERLARHQQAWRDAATRSGCRLLAVRAEDLLAGSLTPLLANGFLEPA